MIYEERKHLIPELLKIFQELNSSLDHDQDAIARDFVKLLSKEHRTSQQSLMKLISKIINEYSKLHCDPRNIDSVNWAKKVSKIPNNFRYI